MGFFLAIAAAALLIVIALQNYLVPALRNQTISTGLTGPDHVALDASYVPLSLAMALVFHQGLAGFLGCTAALALLLVATTNTAWAWVDKLTGGQHAKWHSIFTLVVFISALSLQCVEDSGWRWIITGLNVLLPSAAYVYFHYKATDVDGVHIQASPAAEKLFVTGLCAWLISWGVR